MQSAGDSFAGMKIIELRTVDSTNLYAAKLLNEENVEEGTVITAKYQSAGKGYTGNTWSSEAEKNLLLSIILYPSFLFPSQQFFLNQIVSLAVADTVEVFLHNSSVRIKWPNDIFADEKKIAGILIENTIHGPMLRHSIAGIGINVNQRKFSPELPHATSFFKIERMEFLLNEVMQELLSRLSKRYSQLKSRQMESIQKDYMKRLYRVEEAAWYVHSDKQFKGKIVGLTAQGKLIIETGGIHEVFGFKEVEMILD